MVRHKTRWILVKLQLSEEEEGYGSISGVQTAGSSTKKQRARTNETSIHTMMMMNSNVSTATSARKEFPTRKDFTARLRRTIDTRYGSLGETISADIQVRFYDVSTQLVLIRVARQYADKVKSSLSVLLTKKRLAAEGDRGERSGVAFRAADVHARVLSVHGSARTAKIGTINKLKDLFRVRLRRQLELCPDVDTCKQSNEHRKSSKSVIMEQKDTCKQFHELLQTVQNID